VSGKIRLLISAVVCLVAALSATTTGFAQNMNVGQKVTATGCLQKGDEANEF